MVEAQGTGDCRWWGGIARCCGVVVGLERRL